MTSLFFPGYSSLSKKGSLCWKILKSLANSENLDTILEVEYAKDDIIWCRKFVQSDAAESVAPKFIKFQVRSSSYELEDTNEKVVQLHVI